MLTVEQLGESCVEVERNNALEVADSRRRLRVGINELRAHRGHAAA